MHYVSPQNLLEKWTNPFWIAPVFAVIFGTAVGCSDDKGAKDEECERTLVDTDTGPEFDFGPCGDNKYDGSFTIADADSLAELSTYTSVEGNLKIEDTTALANLDGLDSLLCVSRNLDITANSALENIDGLSNLVAIGGAVTIGDYNEGNSLLANLDGLSSLTSIGGHLWIEHNNVLANVDGLSSLASVGEFLGVFGNPSLTSLTGLGSLETVDGLLNIAENEKLPTCEGTKIRDLIGTECRDVCIRLNLSDSCSDDDEDCWYDRCSPGDECDDY